MRYCQSCDAEVPEASEQCPTCQGPLVEAPPKETRRFVVAGTADYPLMAENLAEAVDAAGISVVVRARRRGVVDPLTSPSLHEWWEILVPEDQLARAEELLQKERARIEADAGEAARAAEEEEAEGEREANATATPGPRS